MSHRYGDLENAMAWTGLIYKGTLRALFEMCIGALLYLMATKIRTIKFTTFGRIILTLFEIFCLISTSIVCLCSIKHYDFFIVALLSLGILLAFSEQTLLLKVANNKLCYFLEKLSLAIYLNHVWIEDLVVICFKITDVKVAFCIVLITTLFVSIIITYLIPIVTPKIMKITKKIFIEK